MADDRTAEAWLFIKQVVKGRWFSVFASFLIMIGCGSTYMYGTYSKLIKTEFDYNQTEVNLLGFAKDLGANIGVTAGLFAEIAPPWMLFLVAACLNFYGYFMMWLAVTRRIAKPEFWHMFVYICIAANSANFANTAVLVTSVRNFPDRRGIILGLLKGFVGIGGAVLNQFYLAIYGHENPANLLLLFSWLPSTVCLIFVLVIRPLKARKHPDELRVFYHLLYVAILLALFILALTITQKQAVFSQSGYISGVAVILGLFCIPLLIAIREELMLSKLKKQMVDPSVVVSIIPEHKPQCKTVPRKLQSLEEITEASTSCFSNICNKPERGDDYTILQAVFSIDMLLICMATITGCGATLAAIDNLGQIGESLSYPTQSIGIFLSWVSILNFFGRVFSGFISETLMVKYKFPRPLMFALAFLFTCIGMLCIAFPSPGSVYIASLIIGFGFGAQVPLLFAIISELFGLKHYSTLFNCGQVTVPIGSYVLNVDIVGKLYDMEAMKGGQVKNGKGLTCVGAHCFSGSFIILSLVTLFGAMAMLVLAFRTRDFYKGDVYKKFKEDMWIPQSDIEFYRLDNKKNNDDDSKHF